MEIITKKLSELKHAPYNPRRITDEALAGLTASLTEYGCIEPIIWNKRTGNVVGGNQRLKVLRAQGDADTEVVVVDLPLNKEKALNIALNSPHIAGDWTPALGDLLDEIKLDLPELYEGLLLDDLAGYPEVELEPYVGETDPDEVPEPAAEPVIQRGDLITLGRHRLLCGDSCKAEDVARLMAEEKALWMWTDPPYGVKYVGKTKDALKIQNDGAAGLSDLLLAVFNCADKILVNGAPIYIAHPPGALSLNFQVAFIGVGWHLHETLVWVKNSMVLGHSDYHYQHEPILYGWKGENRFWYGDRCQTSIFEIDRPSQSPDHPTKKPIDLVLAHLTNSSRYNDLGYDPFLGSGTTMIACETLGRTCYGMEISPQYVDVSCRRWISFTGKPEDVSVERGGKRYKWEELKVA